MHTHPTWIALGALALTSACGPSETLRPPPAAPASAPTPAPTPLPAGASSDPVAPPSGPALAGQLHVVARVIEQGPIGSGNCSQRSYRIEVVSGDPLPTPSWVHFEHCAGDPEPSFAGTALSVGNRYALTLAPGASPNFGADPMIVGVEPATAP